jgi:hypothetical protein
VYGEPGIRHEDPEMIKVYSSQSTAWLMFANQAGRHIDLSIVTG